VITSSDRDATTDADARAIGAAGFVAKDDLPSTELTALLTGHSDPE
jgi:hypothetical protein